MSTERITDDTLDALFAEACALPPPPVPEALMARVLADAAAAQPRPAPVPRRRAGWLNGLFAALGGRATAGLVAAGLAGVWIGFVQPLDLTFQGLSTAAVETLDLYPADLDTLSEMLAPELTPEG